MTEELWLSQSRINAYLTCPLYYKLNYIDKVPVDSKGTYATALGNGVHKVLQEFYELLKTDRERLTYDDKAAIKLLYALWEMVCQEGYEEKNGQYVPPLTTNPDYSYPRGEEETKMLYHHGRKMLYGYYNHNRSDFLQHEVVATELNFKVPVGKDGHVILNGYIDRIDRDAQGQLVVVDYKTGKERTQADVEWDTQLTIYALAVRKLFQEQEGYLYLHFLRSGNKVRVTRAKAHFDDLLVKIKQVQAGLAAQAFEPRLGSQCRYCVFECPIGGSVAERQRRS